jgi:hypothetical protein
MTGAFKIHKAAAWLGWRRESYWLAGGYLAVMGMVVCLWWPLAKDAFVEVDGWNGRWNWHMDWLLMGNFLAMFLLIMAKPELGADAKIAVAGLAGGLAIECWGTQTNLWTYYTTQRPPLWIIPAWALSSLATERLARAMDWAVEGRRRRFKAGYWLIFGEFYALLVCFSAPTLDKPLTWAALALCALIIVTPVHPRRAALTFLAGSGLGYFLERWGTTRGCWTYYTGQTPPVFAVFAHGMACVAFRHGRIAWGWLRRWRRM